jgi:flagellar basal body-associated protein FliL
MPDTPRTAPARKGTDLRLAMGVGALVLMTAASAWWFTRGPAPTATGRPLPVYLGLDTVISPLDDGQRLRFQVALRLQDPDALKTLTAHAPALKVMVQDLGQHVDPEELQSPEGIQDFSRSIRNSVNNYLRRQQLEPRVMSVAFSELVRMD